MLNPVFSFTNFVRRTFRERLKEADQCHHLARLTPRFAFLLGSWPMRLMPCLCAAFDAEALRKETGIMKLVDHQNCVKLHEVCALSTAASFLLILADNATFFRCMIAKIRYAWFSIWLRAGNCSTESLRAGIIQKRMLQRCRGTFCRL